jgi:DNA-binding response OmpR family regulator
MKILITEDDVMLADCLEDALAELGHTVCGVAHNVSTAVELARLHHPDIAILDMQLAGSELGIHIVDQLVATGDLGNLGVLYITGEVERVHREARFGHGCLKKPYSMVALAAALEIVRAAALDYAAPRNLPIGMGLLGSALADTAHLLSPTIDVIASGADRLRVPRHLH